MNEQAKPIRVFLIDDHKIFRDGIKALFFGDVRFKVVGEEHCGREFLKKCQFDMADVALIDIDLPEMTGFEVVRSLSEQEIAIKKIMLSADKSRYSIVESVKAGADGYLHKDTSKEEIVNAIETVMGGRRFFGKSVSKTVFEAFSDQVVEQNFKGTENPVLSSREIEILKCISDGFTFKEIAQLLSISARTVESHKTNMQKKLGINTMAGLIKFAMKNNLID